MLTDGSREKTAEAAVNRARAPASRQNGERRLAGNRRSAASETIQARTSSPKTAYAAEMTGVRKAKRRRRANAVFRYATRLAQRPAASEPGRASSISITGMSETIGYTRSACFE